MYVPEECPVSARALVLITRVCFSFGLQVEKLRGVGKRWRWRWSAAIYAASKPHCSTFAALPYRGNLKGRQTHDRASLATRRAIKGTCSPASQSSPAESRPSRDRDCQRACPSTLFAAPSPSQSSRPRSPSADPAPAQEPLCLPNTMSTRLFTSNSNNHSTFCRHSRRGGSLDSLNLVRSSRSRCWHQVLGWCAAATLRRPERARGGLKALEARAARKGGAFPLSPSSGPPGDPFRGRD